MSTGPNFFSKLKSQPAGVYLLFSTELWERFSYYGMLGLLSLYLVAPASRGGFGWNNSEALWTFGIFLSTIWFAPLVGGYLSDRFCGPRRAVIWGCSALSLGNMLLATRAWLPQLTDQLTGVNTAHFFQGTGAVLGRAWMSGDVLERLSASTLLTTDSATVSAAVWCYRLIDLSLWTGLVALVIGAGLFKSNVSVLMGGLFSDDKDVRRDFGFTIFYMGINVGALIAPLVAGTLGERVGWHWGFLASSLGMLIGIFIFVRFQSRVLGETPAAPRSRAVQNSPLTQLEKRKVLAIGVFALFATVFTTGLMQYGGLLNLFTAQNIDRHVGTFEIPTTWFLTLNPLYIILFGPAVGSIWDSRARQGLTSSSSHKFAAGLLLMALAFAVIAFTAQGAAPYHLRSWHWIPVFYFLLTLGELCVLPIGLALVSRLAPPRWIGVLMGSWLLTYALGSAIASALGVIAQTTGAAVVFCELAVVASIACILIVILRIPLFRYLHEQV